ncbi:MAG: hypothetical protein WDO74_07565 [Pseudomonadota bacterium]
MPLLALVAIVGLPELAHAQAAVNGCQTSQFLDRTAPSADRQIAWDFSITSDPERCLRVQVGQTVVWNGDLGSHPLDGNGGDSPNPIRFHQNGSVTFNATGTFGFVCTAHSPMKGAVYVVPGATPAATVPALAPWAAMALTFLLLGSGLIVVRGRRRRAPASV